MSDLRIRLEEGNDLMGTISFDRLIYLCKEIDVDLAYNSKKEKLGLLIVRDVPNELKNDCLDFVDKTILKHQYEKEINKFIKDNLWRVNNTNRR